MKSLIMMFFNTAGGNTGNFYIVINILNNQGT